jgi:hypothetical protein
VNLRQLWAKAQDDYPIIADFDIDPYYMLQVVALVSRPTPSAKRGDVLDLETSAIEEWWDRAVRGMAKGLEILRDDCGVITATWLPYNTIVNPLAAVLAKLAVMSSAAVGANRHKLTRRFWCSVFGQTYENAPNSQTARDVTELIGWLTDGEVPGSLSHFRFDPRILRDTTPRQRAVYRGTICLILRNAPRDFHNGARLTGDLMIEHHVDDHHVFPQAYLARVGVEARARLCAEPLPDRPEDQYPHQQPSPVSLPARDPRCSAPASSMSCWSRITCRGRSTRHSGGMTSKPSSTGARRRCGRKSRRSPACMRPRTWSRRLSRHNRQRLGWEPRTG